MEKPVVESEYFQIFRYGSDTKDFNLDYKNVNFDKYYDFFKRKKFKMITDLIDDALNNINDGEE